MSFSIYLVDDEKNLNEILTSYLENEGFTVSSFTTGMDAKKVINNPPHLWILDIMLPDIDGFQLIKEIKKITPNVPVIFISARDASLDRVVGLEMGSDDYLPKPFLPRELIIRVHKLLDRVYPNKDTKTLGSSYEIDEKRRIVSYQNTNIELTSKEFDILLLFFKNPNQAFSREQILNSIWGVDYFGSDRVVDDLVRRLRKKLDKLRLETIYGFGYRLVED